MDIFSERLAGGLLLAGAVIFLLAGCGSAAALPSSLAATRGDPEPCAASQLDGLVVFGGVATGHTNDRILLRDHGTAPCTIEGYADVRIVGASGATLATAGGTAGRGTFFGDGPVVPVVLAPDTPALRQGATPGRYGAPGQALMNLEWYDCQQRHDSRLLVDLPDGRGQLTLTAPAPAHSPACDAPGHGADSGLLRGPVSPAGTR